MLRSYDRAMWLRRTRKGWAEPAPKRCANGHELRGGTCLVGTQHCDCMRTHRIMAKHLDGVQLTERVKKKNLEQTATQRRTKANARTPR